MSGLNHIFAESAKIIHELADIAKRKFSREVILITGIINNLRKKQKSFTIYPV